MASRRAANGKMRADAVEDKMIALVTNPVAMYFHQQDYARPAASVKKVRMLEDGTFVDLQGRPV